jgi:hypothetical protein
VKQVDVFFQEPQASELTRLRIKARRQKRIPYDCLGAIVKGDSVVCKWGHRLRGVGNRTKPGMSLLSVLKGMSSSFCQSCKDYDEEFTE